MDKSKKLIIYGDSSYAEMIGDYFQSDSIYEVVAFCADRAYRTRDIIQGKPVFDLEEITQKFSNDHYIFAAIGYKSVRTHKTLFEKIATFSYPIASYISTQSIIGFNSHIGENCLILPGVIIEPNVTIEQNCFINSGAIVSHHAKIQAHSVLASGSIVGGYASVGECSLIGFNATVTELVSVAEETLLGAGSVLLQNTEPCSVYVGSPAKLVRKHQETGIVLEPQKK